MSTADPGSGGRGSGGRDASGLHASGVHGGPGPQPLLSDLELTALGGELVAVDSPSGSGNSLLLAILAGAARPTSGSVTLDGVPIGEARSAGRVALLQQDGPVADELTTAETVSIPLRVAGLSAARIAEGTTRWLGAFGLAPAAGQLAGQLSGGQRQRMGLSRCFAAGARLLVLDDPTAELDPANRLNVVRLLRGWVDECNLAVVATHDPDLLIVADRRLSISAGRLVPAG